MITRNTLYGIPWIDLENPSVQEIHTVIEDFGINEACAVELMKPSLRAKVVRYDDYLFFVLHFPSHPAQEKGGSIEIDFIVHKDFIITSRYSPIDVLLAFEKKHGETTEHDQKNMHGGILFELMIDDLYSGLIDELTLIKKDITEMEVGIFEETKKNISKELMKLHRKLLDCKSALRFHHEILTSFESESIGLFGKNFESVTQKILHKYYHLTTLVDSAREIILELRETYDALLANRTNDAMKTLTLMSFMTFPLVLLVALATFPGAPKSWHTEQGFYILISIIVIIGITMITFFKRKDWL